MPENGWTVLTVKQETKEDFGELNFRTENSGVSRLLSHYLRTRCDICGNIVAEKGEVCERCYWECEALK